MEIFIIILLGLVVYLLLDIKRTVQKKHVKETIINVRKIRRELKRSIRKDD